MPTLQTGWDPEARQGNRKDCAIAIGEGGTMIAARPSGMNKIRESRDSVPFYGTKKSK